MNTKSITMTRTLRHVLLAALILTGLALLLPGRSEAAIRINARIGAVRIDVNSDPCCTAPAVVQRHVVVRSIGRERVVIRNDYGRHTTCRGVVRENPHHRHGQVWVPGHYKTKVKRHGRLKKIWVPGHWTRL